jgi:NADPH:quinone reductase-like Zn-dependent oxidoreductase
MKAVTCRSYGVLRLAEVDEPVPGTDDVLVDVQAASVNAADWHLVRGAPYIARLRFGLRRPNFGIPGSDQARRSEPSGATSSSG